VKLKPMAKSLVEVVIWILLWKVKIFQSDNLHKSVDTNLWNLGSSDERASRKPA
jgi:hypothetical protein